MLTHKVRTYSVHRETPKMALYILNRGRNAGKPMLEPCPNCFILYCGNAEEVETYYWTFYAFWKHGFFPSAPLRIGHRNASPRRFEDADALLHLARI